MADKLRTLSEGDRDILNRMIREFFGNSPRPRGRGREGFVEHEEHQAPEVYVARVPEEGIPAATWNICADVGTGTGTGTWHEPGTGTGTGTGPWPGEGEADYVLGSAVCDIYEVNPETGAALVIEDLNFLVYNTAETDIPACTLVPVIRDKFGVWYAVAGGPGGTAELSGCTIDLKDPTTIDGYDSTKKQALIHDPDGVCFRWMTIDTCPSVTPP